MKKLILSFSYMNFQPRNFIQTVYIISLLTKKPHLTNKPEDVEHEAIQRRGERREMRGEREKIQR